VEEEEAQDGREIPVVRARDSTERGREKERKKERERKTEDHHRPSSR